MEPPIISTSTPSTLQFTSIWTIIFTFLLFFYFYYTLMPTFPKEHHSNICSLFFDDIVSLTKKRSFCLLTYCHFPCFNGGMINLKRFQVVNLQY